MPFERTKVLIWGKTYPELSYKYVETVCTGGVREDGSPIRLFPVPLRYLNSPQQYRLYDWIDVAVQKSTRDPRPESFKVDRTSVRVVGHLDTSDGWHARRAAVFKDPRWQFGSVEALKAARKERGCSLGIVTPGAILSASLEQHPPKHRKDFETKWAKIQSQGHFFDATYKELQYLPWRIRLSWRCADPCVDCARAPHNMGVLDWGLLELARKPSGGPDKAVDRLRRLANLTAFDFKIFMGTFHARKYQFGVIGLWYPKLEEQLPLGLGG